jgi:hypothetical protein
MINDNQPESNAGGPYSVSIHQRKKLRKKGIRENQLLRISICGESSTFFFYMLLQLIKKEKAP